MSDTKERKLVDVSALIAGDVQFVQVDVWTEAKGLHHVKLRVVEEVSAPLEQVDMDKWWTCSGCKESFLSYHNPPNYCPGCGNKIKP